MKTKEEILTELANEHSYETWGDLMYDSHDHWQVHCTKEAMEKWANQQNAELRSLLDSVAEALKATMSDAPSVKVLNELMPDGGGGRCYPIGTKPIHEDEIRKAWQALTSYNEYKKANP